MAKVVGVGAADAAAALRRVHELAALRRWSSGIMAAGEVERGAGDVRVDVHAAGEDDHAGRVDGAAALDVGDDAAVGDADVLDHAVDAVGGVVDLAAGDPQHELSGQYSSPTSPSESEG